MSNLNVSVNTDAASWTETDWGLALFILVAALNALGLLVDYYLSHASIPTITDVVRARGPAGIAAGAVILALNAAGLVGLAWHFYGAG